MDFIKTLGTIIREVSLKGNPVHVAEKCHSQGAPSVFRHFEYPKDVQPTLLAQHY